MAVLAGILMFQLQKKQLGWTSDSLYANNVALTRRNVGKLALAISISIPATPRPD